MPHIRRSASLLVLGLGVLLLGITGAWFWATHRMLAEWDAWQAQAALQGVRVQSAPPRRAGWPVSAELVLPAVTADLGLAAVRADAIRLRLTPLDPTRLAIAAEGEMGVRVAGLPPIAIGAHTLSATVALADPERVRFAGTSITAALPAGPLSIGTLQGTADPAGLRLEAGQIGLPLAGLAFGSTVQQASAQLRTTRPVVLPGPGAAWPDASRAAAAWAQGGNQVVADDVRLLWGPLDARGRVTLGLDAGLQPEAIGALHLTGYRQAIDGLVRSGAVAANAARVATTVLDMMASPAEPGAVDVPLSLRAGTVAMGAIPLARIAPVAWP